MPARTRSTSCDGRPAAEALPITATQSKHLWDALCGAYDRLGLNAATGGDEVFRALVLARLVEPTSKLDAIRVLTDLGTTPPGYRTIFRRLPSYATDAWRQALAGACAEHVGLGPAPHRVPLTDRRGRHRRFRTPEAARAAVDRGWP